jgi:integrase
MAATVREAVDRSSRLIDALLTLSVAATLMLSKGVHPKIVSERLGHASVGITLDTYSHVLPSMQAEAAAAFDEIFESKARR